MHQCHPSSYPLTHPAIPLQPSSVASKSVESFRSSTPQSGEGEERNVIPDLPVPFDSESSSPLIHTTPPSSPPSPPLHSHSPATTHSEITSPPLSPRSSSSTERTFKASSCPPPPPTSSTTSNLKRSSSPLPHAYAFVPPSTSSLINNLANNLLSTSSKVGRSSSISSDTSFRSRLSSSSSSRSTDLAPLGSPSIAISILPARWPALECSSPSAEEETMLSEDGEMKEDPLKVEIAGEFYELSCFLPSVLLENITIANKNDGVLKIYADRFTSEGEFQFNRSIEFAQDAELNKARARFDGDTLKISIPRSQSAPVVPVLPRGASTLRSTSLRRRQGSIDLTDRSQERESSWDKFCEGERSFESHGYGGVEETIVEGKVSS